MSGQRCRTGTLTWVGILLCCAAMLCVTACGATTVSRPAARPTPSATAPPTATATAVPLTIALRSPAFEAGAYIPPQYTCNGDNISPPLAWGNVPGTTVSFVLLMHDVTGPTLTHWVVFNIPASTRTLPANIPEGGLVAGGARQGTSGLRVVGYRGPCPALPRGSTHDYVFTLYALDSMLPLDGGATEDQVLAAATGHLLARGQTDGMYKLQHA